MRLPSRPGLAAPHIVEARERYTTVRHTRQHGPMKTSRLGLLEYNIGHDMGLPAFAQFERSVLVQFCESVTASVEGDGQILDFGHLISCHDVSELTGNRNWNAERTFRIEVDFYPELTRRAIGKGRDDHASLPHPGNGFAADSKCREGRSLNGRTGNKLIH